MSSLPKVIRDPVHNLIELPDDDEGRMILALIDRPEFQRLRRIRQLGLGFLVYPGAEHSRWAHSLGVCHIARRMLDALAKHHGEDSDEYRDLRPLRRTILAAALLHDLGHGPFSHVFERAIKPPTAAQDEYPRDHEGWSRRIIRERLAGVLCKYDVEADKVVQILNKEDRGNLLSKDFVSSQLDADRMDYLLRDSKACGPRYGEFDLDWMLHSLRIGKVSVKGQADGVWRLCLDSRKAIHVVEEFIQAREFIYLQVYVHRTTRAYEALLTNILALAAAIADGDPGKVPGACPEALREMLAGRQVDTDSYMSLDDFRLWCTFMDWSKLSSGGGENAARLARMCLMLVHRKQPYKCIELHERGNQDKALEFITKLKGTDLFFSCSRDTFSDLAYRNALYRQSKHSGEAGEEEEDKVIFFLDKQGKPHPAESESKVIDAISKIETSVYRLYYDERESKLVEELLKGGWDCSAGNSGKEDEG
ncbi:MAG: HD domain-containing protein [Phycisphaerales bacterium]|nr:HD domain-containing protein [Phycisphaerales bacterium]